MARTMTMAEANQIAQKRIEELEAENQRLREAAEKRRLAGHNDTCSFRMHCGPCSCGHNELVFTLQGGKHDKLP